MVTPGTKAGSPKPLAEFKGSGVVNFNGGNRIIRGVNERSAGGRFGQTNDTPISRSIDARITGSVVDGSNFRWFYTWEEVYRKSTGYGGWERKVGGYSGTSSNAKTRAYNRLEDINAESGMTGIGVDLDNLPDGFTLQPIPPGTPVEIKFYQLADGSTEYWFSAPNGIDGTCST